MTANQSSDNSADQYFELEVTPPNSQSVYSYLRLGTWGDDPNSGAGKMQALQEAATAAGNSGDPSQLIAQLTAIAGAEASDENAALRSGLQAAATKRNSARTARNNALAAYKAVRTPYETAGEQAVEAHAEMVKWKNAYDSTPASDAQKRSSIHAEYQRKKTAYEQKKQALETAKAAMEPKAKALQEASDAYQGAKGELTELVSGAVSQAQSSLIEAATNNENDRKRGHDLAMRIVDFFDDTRERGVFQHLTVPQRKAESAKLHTKGGWRDHTEGNRISTTRGDKIEVIHGNYRRMVLGRQDDSDEACLLDASGGLYMDGDFAPGSVVLVEYSTKYDDTWKCVEECSKGDVINKYHGDVEEHFYGNYVTSYVGKPGGNDWEDSEAIKPTVVEKTWAKTITAETHADDITETTRLTGTMKSDTTVGAGVVDMLAVGAGLVEMVTVGASHISMEASTTQIDLNLAPAHLSVDLSLGMLDLYVGGKIEICVAKHLAIDVGPRFEMNATTDFNMELQTDEITPLKNDIAAMKTEIGTQKTSIGAMKKDISASQTDLAASKKSIGAMEKKIKGALIIL